MRYFFREDLDGIPFRRPELSRLSIIIIIIIKIVHEVQKDRIRQKKGQNKEGLS